MNSLNSLIIEGNALEDVEIREELGLKQATFEISVKRYFKNALGENDEEESIFEVQCFGTLADLGKKICKGRGVRIVGRLKQLRWGDNNEYSKVVVIAEHIEFKAMPQA